MRFSATGRRRMCASSSSPTVSAFSASATWASEEWGSRSASLRSTRPAREFRRSTACRSLSTSGSNNAALLEDPLYLGLRQNRVRGEEYMAFIDEFVTAVQARYPKCCIQWEDFANINAVPILERYRDRVCTYNDDIQGTAAVALAGIFGALRISGQRLTEQRFLFLGGGSAATGIAELISRAMALEGLDIGAARARNALFDINGLMVKSRTDLAAFQKPFAQDHVPVDKFVTPCGRCGPPASSASAPCPNCSTNRSSRPWPRSMSGPLSFHTRIPHHDRSARRTRLTAGRAAVPSLRAGVLSRRSKSPARHSCRDRATMSTSFPPWAWRCTRRRRPRVTEEMFIIAAKAVAEQVSDASLATGLIYPPQSRIFEASLHVAVRVAGYIFEKGLGTSATSERYCRAYPGSRLPPRLSDVSARGATESTAIQLTANVAVALFENGQTTERTIESARRVAKVLGFEADAYLRWGEVRVRLGGEAGPRGTVIAAEPVGVDMGKVAATLEVIEKLERGQVSAPAADTALRAIVHRPPVSDTRFALFAAAGAVALGVIFGLTHVFAAVVIALSAGFGACLRRWLARKTHNALVQPFCAALLAGVVAALALYLRPDEPQRLVAVCPCMVLVPGPHILNGALDLARARIPLGAARIGYALLIVFMICTGLLLGLSFGGVTLPVSSPAVAVPLLFDVLAAGVAVAAYATFFSMPVRMMPLPILVGMVAHGARWAAISFGGANVEAAALLACLIVGSVTTPLADRMRMPFAAVAFASVVALIPGVYVFRMAGGFTAPRHTGSGGATRGCVGHTGRWRHSVPHHARHGVWTHPSQDVTGAPQAVKKTRSGAKRSSSAKRAAPAARTAASTLRWEPTVSSTGELLLRRRETPEPGSSADMHYTFSQSLIFLARRWRNLMNHELSSVGQSQARWGTLYWIDVFGDSLNQTELADRIGVEQQTLGRVLRDLQSEGLIERVASQHDQRAKVIRLTAAADPVMRQIAAIQESVRKQLLRDISPEKLGVCMAVFAAILATWTPTEAEPHAAARNFPVRSSQPMVKPQRAKRAGNRARSAKILCTGIPELNSTPPSNGARIEPSFPIPDIHPVPSAR